MPDVYIIGSMLLVFILTFLAVAVYLVFKGHQEAGKVRSKMEDRNYDLSRDVDWTN